jgi:hypothetical protein
MYLLCPADLAERHLTFIADDIDPGAALRQLAAQEHCSLAQNGQVISITASAP